MYGIHSLHEHLTVCSALATKIFDLKLLYLMNALKCRTLATKMLL